MQEKKNKRSFILLVVLVSATAAVFWFGKEQSTYAVDPSLFKNYDLKSIDEIQLESPGQKVNLKYSGARWKVNDQHGANSDMIEVLFATLQQAEPKRPIALSLQDSLSTLLKESGVKVALLSGGKPKEIFYAGGNSSKSQAYFLKDGSNVPYVMSIPGYRVYVSGIFELNENTWRDKFVFGFNWRNFQRLEVSFLKKPNDEFAVAMDDGYFGIERMEKVDTTKLNDFLDAVSLLIADEYLSDASPDNVVETDPAVSFLVKDIAGKEYLLQLYPLQGDGRQYYGLINRSQWALFGRDRISDILRPRNYFVKSD